MSLPEPITRREQYYDGIARGNASKLPEPITREEQYLEYIAKNGGGGGGGTTDYEALDNKPSVNGVELSGNKTLDDLGIQEKLTFDNEPTEDSQNPVKSGGVYDALESLDEAISRKPDEYADLTDKPQINGETLSGNKTASDLGLQTELKGTQTVEGNPITIIDAEAMNAESVKVELEPKQDLHGYDGPWVGGAGKNKLNYDAWKSTTIQRGTAVWENNGVTLTATDEDCYTTPILDSRVEMSEGETIILSWDADTNTDGRIFIFPNDSSVGMTTANNSDSKSLSYTATAGVSYVTFRFGVTNNGDTIAFKNIMIRLSTETDPTFEPYSNICPITGYSEVNLERVGKNIWNGTYSSENNYLNESGGLVSHSGWNITDYIRVKQGNYVLSTNYDNIAPSICWYDSSKNFIGGLKYNGSNTVNVNLPSNAVYIRFSVDKSDTHLQLEEVSTATIDLGGTKYGGTLDVTEGGFIDDHGHASINYASLVDGLFREQAPNDVNWSYPSCKCSCLEVWDTVDDLANNYGISYDDGYFYMNLPPECGATESAVQTWLQNNPIDVVYVTRDVTEESTTPTDIELLENTNNISTNGTNIQLKYQPNNVIGECKAYTDEQCAKVLPPLPTTDGTYHLSCEVTSGAGVLSWVSDS